MDIEGVAMGKGNTLFCKMQRDLVDGTPFADIMMISAGSDGLTVIDAYVTKTEFPDGSSPSVAIYFDGTKAAELKGSVKQGYAYADIAKVEPSRLINLTKLITGSKDLVILSTLDGFPNEKKTVDLADSADAFKKRGACSKAVFDVGMARLKAGN